MDGSHTEVLTPSRSYLSVSVRPYELYMLVISVTSLVILAADALWTFAPPIHQVLGYADTMLCAVFFLDFLRSYVSAADRRRYFFRAGWLDLISSFPAIGYLRLGRLSRIARIVRLLR